jgi:hypothetical protein
VCDGGCFKLTSDPNHCGSCSVSCAVVANASPRCLDGGCAFECSENYLDCDKIAANGCECNLTTSSCAGGHCNACSVVGKPCGGDSGLTCCPGLQCPLVPRSSGICCILAGGACAFNNPFACCSLRCTDAGTCL